MARDRKNWRGDEARSIEYEQLKKDVIGKVKNFNSK